MATDVKLPRLGQGMESGTIVKWLKAEGDRVEKGEPLYELDTDKATQEVEAEASGVLLKIAVPSGEVPVGQTVATIGEAGESPPEPAEEESAGRARRLLPAPTPSPSRSPAGRRRNRPRSPRRATGQASRVRPASRRRRSPAGSRASAGSSSQA